MAVRKIAGNPIKWIEAVYSIPLLLFAIYLVSPLYHVVTATSISLSFETFSGRVTLCIFYGLPALVTLVGLLTPKWSLSNKLRSYGAFLQALGYLFLTTLRWITIGFFPVLWMFTLALSLIAAVVHLSLQWESCNDG